MNSFHFSFYLFGKHLVNTSLVAQMVKSLPAMQDTQVRSLGQENPLETEMATHSSILAWKIPWMEEPGSIQAMGSQRVGQDWAINSFISLHPRIQPTLGRVTPQCLFIENENVYKLTCAIQTHVIQRSTVLYCRQCNWINLGFILHQQHVFN